jgi:hypothetical protein
MAHDIIALDVAALTGQTVAAEYVRTMSPAGLHALAYIAGHQDETAAAELLTAALATGDAEDTIRQAARSLWHRNHRRARRAA